LDHDGELTADEPLRDRSELAEAFVAKYGWGSAGRSLLKGDASEKTFVRLTDDTLDPPGTAIFMDWPAPEHVVARFIRIQELLISLGINAPEILARDLDSGFMLLEDLGDLPYGRMIDTGSDAKPLLKRATKLLIALGKRFDEPMGRGLPVYDAATFADQSALFLDSYMRGADLLPEDAMELQELVDIFIQVWEAALQVACETPQGLILRDYIADNLMHVEIGGAEAPTEDGTAQAPAIELQQVGVIDFQDGGIGPRLYDLVSLLEDVRRDIPAETKAMMQQGYLKSSGLDEAAFRSAYNIMKAQRMTRILGVFARLAIDEGNDSYMKFVPRAWQLLEEALVAEPELDGVRAWFDRNVPEQYRAALVG